MSHFTVLVISDDAEMETIKRLLQPFHQYECTGTEDQYVVFVDHTDELMDKWATEMVDRVRAPDGSLLYGFEFDIFYRDPTDAERELIGLPPGEIAMPFLSDQGSFTLDGKKHQYRTERVDGLGRVTRVHYLPEGYGEGRVPVSEAFDNLEEYAKEWHGWSRNAEGRFGTRTNPNYKWDWWKVGGRWSGMLLGLGGAGLKGEPGLMGAEYSATGVDQVRRDQLDIETMARIARERRHEAIQGAFAAIRRRDAWAFVDMQLGLAAGDETDVRLVILKRAKADPRIVEKQDPARFLLDLGVMDVAVVDFFKSHAALTDEDILDQWRHFGPLYERLLPQWEALNKAFSEAWDAGQRDIEGPGRLWDWLEKQNADMKAMIDLGIPFIGDYGFSGAGVPWEEPDPFAWAERAPAITTYAICDSEGWHQRGQMGWWGVTSGDTSEIDWEAAYRARLERIRPDQYLTVIDCHI